MNILTITGISCIIMTCGCTQTPAQSASIENAIIATQDDAIAYAKTIIKNPDAYNMTSIELIKSKPDEFTKQCLGAETKHEWWVSYDGKTPMPGNHCTVVISAETRRHYIVPGA